MSHIYKASVWSNSPNIWEVNDVCDVAHSRAGKWWVAARVMNLSPESYVLLLKDKYHAVGFKYNRTADFLNFYFTNEKDAKAYVKDINAIAKKRKFLV